MFLVSGMLMKVVDNNNEMFEKILLGRSLMDLDEEKDLNIILDCIHVARTEIAYENNLEDFIDACRTENPRRVRNTFEKLTFSNIPSSEKDQLIPIIIKNINKMIDDGIEMYTYFHEYFNNIHGMNMNGWITSLDLK